MAEFIRVNGSKNIGDVRLYTLSTCGWCKKTKSFLESHDVSYAYIDMDMLFDDEDILRMEQE
ncbi:MAG: glutaredoxin domain-containing protein, partial [Christensenellaceae bacterium]